MNFLNKEKFLRLFVLVGWCLFFLFPIITGQLMLFVVKRSVPLVVFAIIVMLTLIVLHLKSMKKQDSAESPFLRKASYAFFLAPLFILIILRPGGLSSFAASQFGLSTEFQGSASELRAIMEAQAETYGQYRRLDVKQILILQGNDPERIDGQYVAVEGLLHREGENFFIVRHLVTCCVAHSRPLALPVEGVEEATPLLNSWVRLMGKTAIDEGTLCVEVDRISEVPQPSNPYLY